MGGSPAPMAVTIPAAAAPPRPSQTTITINNAGDTSLQFVFGIISAYGDDNPASLHHYVLVSTDADASKFVFGMSTLRKNQEKVCVFPTMDLIALLDCCRVWCFALCLIDKNLDNFQAKLS